jgi:adenine-specific DNA-methyltransferase
MTIRTQQQTALPDAEAPDTRLGGASLDITAKKLGELLALFPEVRTEDGQIDFERLRLALGDSVEIGKERYGLTWPGKAECFKTIQAPSTATLLPAPEKSANFDTTENIIVEGDNLEVLKLLQKSYLSKIKMIYIDPPYNTGNDFIYPDDYSESLATYLAYTGQIDSDGKRFSTNTDVGGRFHSKWLNMMYSRMYLARNLLREDGVIFASVDDNEAGALQFLMSEIFGQENHVATLYVQVRFASKTLTEKNDFQKLIEQVIVFRKSDAFVPSRGKSEYSLDKFEWKITTSGKGKHEVLGNRDISRFGPGEYRIEKVSPSIDGLKETWATGTVLRSNASGKFFAQHLAPRKELDGLGVLYKVEGIGEDGLGYRYFTGPRKESATKGKMYSGVPNERRAELAAGAAIKEEPIANFHDFSHAFGNCRHEGGVDYRNGKKPVAFLTWLLDMVTTDDDDIIMDFFAGSGSLAQAVLEANEVDGRSLRFILVELPEPASEYGFATTADLAEERVRRAIEKLNAAEDGKLKLNGPEERDRGFRVFRLAESNVKEWDAGVSHDVDALKEQLELGVDHLVPGRTDLDIVYEVLLKSGYPLSAKISTDEITGKRVYSVADGAFLICLERKLSLDLIRAIAARSPERVLCLDEGFAGNDQLKTNAVQTFKGKNITFRTL